MLLVVVGVGCRRASDAPTNANTAGAGGKTDTVARGAGVGAARDADAAGEVVLYCSVDERIARSIVGTFERRARVRVRMLTDTEAGKTTGLVNRIMAEAGRAGADVFWSSEVFNTIVLARRDLLEPYDSPAAKDIPSRYRDSQGRWTATALRARVIAFDSAVTDRASLPTTLERYAEPAWASRLALANPLFGTTRGHVSAMFALWGPSRGEAFLEHLVSGGALVVDGNSAAVRAVISGGRAVCMTDTDDVIAGRKLLPTLDCIYPDLGDGGTLLIPCTVALVRNGSYPGPARALYDYLVSAEVERRLALSESKNIPVRPALRASLGVTLPDQTQLSYDAVVGAMDGAVAASRRILLK